MAVPPSPQAPHAVVMIRPHRFSPNPETCADNRFQTIPARPADEVARAAHAEVGAMARALDDAGVRVHLFEDIGADAPDSVFPNNWLSTHHGGRVVVYPMHAPSRRGERRPDVVETLRREYEVSSVHDYSGCEARGRYLEGTGSMVLDHVHRVAYVCRSNRVSASVLRRFCADTGYRSLVFDAADATGAAVYHTNVLMSVGTDLALVCLDAITRPEERRRVRTELERSGRQVVELSMEQVGEFAGNALEVAAPAGGTLVISERGLGSLSGSQRRAVEAHVRVLPVRVPTIEHAGGSARCMLAGIHLTPRHAADRQPALAQ